MSSQDPFRQFQEMQEQSHRRQMQAAWADEEAAKGAVGERLGGFGRLVRGLAVFVLGLTWVALLLAAVFAAISEQFPLAAALAVGSLLVMGLTSATHRSGRS